MQDESEKKIVKNQYWVVEVGMAGVEVRVEERGTRSYKKRMRYIVILI